MSERPALLITNKITPYRREPFQMLGRAENVEVAIWDDPDVDAPEGLVVHRVSQVGAVRLAASGAYRAIVCGLNGRLALPGSYVAARRRGVPFVLWATMWSHPLTLAHVASRLPTHHIYRHADAVATYGTHVTRYVERYRGARGRVFEAAQAVSAAEYGRPVEPGERAAARERAGAADGAFLALFVGRLARDKGIRQLLEAWEASGLGAQGSALALAGDGPLRAVVDGAGPGVKALGSVPASDLPALYAAADVLVLPSIRTATCRETWGFVVNEAMHQGTPVIATTGVGAVAGGLVRDGRNGLVVPERDPRALAASLRALASDEELRSRLASAARDDIGPFSHEAWVEGMRRALRSVGASLENGAC